MAFGRRPRPDEWIGTWGKGPTSPRGERMAALSGAPILRVEDAFLRSVRTGREGDAPIGLCLDTRGVHYDSSAPSDLEHLLATHPLDDSNLMRRAREAIARIRHAHLSKYNAYEIGAALPESPYVLVVDQTRGDASIRHGGATEALFREMLVFAQTEHPGMKVVIKSHPETLAGKRGGHFGPEDENERISILRDPVSPWALLEGAVGVYTVSSQLGFEAIFAGHKPRVFGQPFYAGWGLTRDENPVPRRARRLSRSQLFAAAMILYPTWYDPAADSLCELEDAIGALEAASRAWREDRQGWAGGAMALWKRPHLQRAFGRNRPMRFAATPGRAAALAGRSGRRLMIWGSGPAPESASAGHETSAPAVRAEDGFLRSRGLGAQLVPPLSLVLDDLGMHYDPSRVSRLERLIARAAEGLPDACLHRARALREAIIRAGLSKYNLPGHRPLPDLPPGKRILVPGQLEDDASVLLGAPREARGNLDLLRRCRAENPDACIIYRPHPDVEAGLRPGAIDAAEALRHADLVIGGEVAIGDLIGACDAVWTLTSQTGFEALLRGREVVCLGMPFYAGWGLTRDLLPAPARRRARPSLDALVHAALIDYPRYFAPDGTPCSPETACRLIVSGEIPARPGLRLLGRLQGIMAGLRGPRQGR